MCPWAFFEVRIQLPDDDGFGLNSFNSQHLKEFLFYMATGTVGLNVLKSFSRKKYLDVFRAEVGYLIDFRTRYTGGFGGQHGLQSILQLRHQRHYDDGKVSFKHQMENITRTK